MDPHIMEKSISHRIIGAQAMFSFFEQNEHLIEGNERKSYLCGKLLGRLRYLYKYYLLMSNKETDLTPLKNIDTLIRQNKINLQLLKTCVSKTNFIPYILYWRIFHKRLPSFFI